MAKLTEKQARLFRDKNWGNVATIRPDGSPHVTPVWVDFDGEVPLFNTAYGRAKVEYLKRDPRIAIEVHDEADPQRAYVSVSGTAELVDEGADEHIDKLAKKYLGVDRYPYRKPDEKRVIVRIRPQLIDAYGKAA
ncbi:MAG TPA: PPOX class F420-dependent oxidoreductase [Gaiellaceae bacterium]